jgi:hypothetical protein
MDTILVVNAGSSSVKFQVFETKGSDGLTRLIKGQMDGIRTRPRLRAEAAGGTVLIDEAAAGLRASARRAASTLPRPTKVGTIASQCPYDAGARDALQSAKLRRSAISRYGSPSFRYRQRSGYPPIAAVPIAPEDRRDVPNAELAPPIKSADVFGNGTGSFRNGYLAEFR